MNNIVYFNTTGVRMHNAYVAEYVTEYVAEYISSSFYILNLVFH